VGTNKTKFDKAKEDHQSELIEDYIEEIAELYQLKGEVRSADLAERLGVSPAAVSKFLNRLKQEQLIEAKPYRGIFLTASGKELAKKVTHRHNLVYQLLITLGVSERIAQADTEGIEHHCSNETVRAIELFLDTKK